MLSIIVPVYNSEAFVGRCIESVLNQSYKDFELILVNDGSTDSTLEVCNEYAKKDKRVIVLNRKHSGVSKSRNAGLDRAKGDYITFIDSDDYVDKERYTITIAAMKKYHADIVQCS
jgi:glycosyltransferase involved in cell wall biosynthesis